MSLNMLLLHGFVFLLGLVCSGTLGLAGYTLAERWPALSPVAEPLVSEAKAMPAPTVETAPRTDLALIEKESRIEYYRGIFDICVFSGRTEAAPERVFLACREVVRRAVAQDWFETPSREWMWPLPSMPSEFEQGG